MKTRILTLIIVFLFCFNNGLFAFNLVESCICEQLVDGQPQYKAVVFSVTSQNLYCYTAFNDIQDEKFIYHIWYYRDKLVSKIKLKLKPPAWATFTKIFLRKSDIGPWRVEVVDEDGNLIDVLRFSVVE